MISLRVVLFLAGLLSFVALERRWPLRQVTQATLRRALRNLSLGGFNTILLNITLLPMVFWASRFTATHHWGLLHTLPLPRWAAILLGLLLMDYTFYWWHYANHRLGFFWRFHNVHHIDLDMDVTTAARFHAGELLLSTFFRSAQLMVLGIDPWTWVLFETLVVSATQFHHSNWKLPIRLESWLCNVIVTPRMHGIHHSIVLDETDSNFSTIFSFWDRLHRSLNIHVPQSQITIGVAAYRDPNEQTLVNIFLMPFRKQRAWALPNGQVPRRDPAPPELDVQADRPQGLSS